MADDIVVTIELEGADTVAAQIAALGDKAKSALDPINKAAAEKGGEGGSGLVTRLFGASASSAAVAAPVAGAAALASVEEERAAAARARATAAISTVAPAVVGEGALLATEERPIPVSSVVAQTLKALGIGGTVAAVGGAAEPAAAGLITKIASVGTSVAGGITTAAPSLTAAVAAAGPALTAAVAAGHQASRAVPATTPEPERPEPGPEPIEPGEGRSIFGGSRRIPVSIVVREALSALGIRFPGAGLAAHVGVEAAEQGGALGAFAAGGVGALAVGGILAGLASVEDRAKKTRQTLDQVFAPQSGGGIGGQGAIERVRGLAERFGTEPETFATPLENLTRGQRQAGAQVPEAINERAITSLYEAIRSGGASTSDAAKALADFTADVEKTGHVSADAVKALEELSQRGADALARSFGRINADRLIQDINRGLVIPIGDVSSRLAAFEGQNRKTFDSAAKDVDTYHTSLSKFGSDLNRDVEKIAGEGSDAVLQRIINFADKLAGGTTKVIGGLQGTTSAITKSVTDFINNPNPNLKDFGSLLSALLLGGGPAPSQPSKPTTPGPGQPGFTPPGFAPAPGTAPVTPGATKPQGFRALPASEEERAELEKQENILVRRPTRREGGSEAAFPEQGYYYTGEGQLRPVPPAEASPQAPQPAGGAPALPAAPVPSGPPPGEAINAALNSIAGSAQGAGAGLQSVAQNAPSAGSGLQQVASSAPQAGTAFSSLSSAVQQISAAIASAVAGIAAAATPPPASGPAAPVEPGGPGGATGGLFTGLNFMRFAPGGPVGGVGTGKSDSNLALLSRGEFVHQEPAVSHYGLSMMHAINNMTFPKFSLGGLMEGISSSMTEDIPRLASGGLATVSSSVSSSPGSVVNLHFPDRSFNNLRTTSKTAEDLRNYSLGRQVASTGTRPSWVGS